MFPELASTYSQLPTKAAHINVPVGGSFVNQKSYITYKNSITSQYVLQIWKITL